MTADRARWARGCAVGMGVIATVLAAATVVHAAEPEALVLSLHSDEGAACLSAAALASALAARVGAPVSTTSDGAALAVSVTVQTTAPRRFAVVIESHDRTNDSSGRRELAIDDACEALTAPISLVIALMIGPQSAPQTAPVPELTQPAPPPEPAPVPAPVPEPAPLSSPPASRAPASTPSVPPTAPPSSTTSRADLGTQSPTRFELGLGGGADFAVLPQNTLLLQLAASIRWVPGSASNRGIPLLTELALELWPPLRFERDGTEVTVTGATIGGSVCSAWSAGALSFEPCAGLWLRPLHGRAPDAAVEADWFLISGWSARARVRLELAQAWSIFFGAQAVMPFVPNRLVLTSSAQDDSSRGDSPFFNAPPSSASVPARRIVLHELPVLGAVFVVGLTLVL